MTRARHDEGPAVLSRRARGGLAFFLAVAALGCRDLSSFTTGGDSYDGLVVEGDFVRTGVDVGTRLCMTLDTDHLQDTPGTLSTSDGRFHAVSLRPIPQIWHDPLSTLSFGDGRLKNLVYVSTSTAPFDDGRRDDVFVVVSLMEAGGVEVRLLRGAPAFVTDGGPPAPSSVFAVFQLARQKGPCSY